MLASGHVVAKCGPEQEVTTLHPHEGVLPSTGAPILEALVRKLIVQARNDSQVCAVINDRKVRVIIDLEVDGLRCMLIRPEETLTSGISFSPRERQIGRMVAKGYPNKTIAAVLEISSWTVCTHLRRMFAKLHVSSRAAMVAQMLDGGIMTNTHHARKSGASTRADTAKRPKR